jgi:hypothetical protein
MPQIHTEKPQIEIPQRTHAAIIIKSSLYFPTISLGFPEKSPIQKPPLTGQGTDISGIHAHLKGSKILPRIIPNSLVGNENESPAHFYPEISFILLA